MANKPLDSNAIAALLKSKAKPQAAGKKSHDVPPVTGPLRFYDNESPCLNSGYYAIDTETGNRYYKKTHGKCGSPTHWEFDGVRYCHIHVLHKMNETIMELRGIEAVEVRDERSH